MHGESLEWAKPSLGVSGDQFFPGIRPVKQSFTVRNVLKLSGRVDGKMFCLLISGSLGSIPYY